MPVSLSKKERLIRQARGQEIDRVPTLGGWIGGVRVLADLAGISTDEYLADPLRGVVKANLALDVDGMIQPVVPRSLDQIRTGSVVEATFAGIEPEALLARADSLPDSESEVLASFDAAAEEAHYRAYFETRPSPPGKASSRCPTSGRSAGTSRSTPSSATPPS